MERSKEFIIENTFVINNGEESNTIKGKIDIVNKEINIKGKVIKDDSNQIKKIG